MENSFENEKFVMEARDNAEVAIGIIDTLHLGPLDYNVATAADYLRTAAGLLEQFQREYLR